MPSIIKVVVVPLYLVVEKKITSTTPLKREMVDKSITDTLQFKLANFFFFH